MSRDHITADSNRNEFPEYMLEKNQKDTSENAALFRAALHNDVPGVREAIAQGGKVDFFNRKDDSKNALHVSSEAGFAPVVDVLLRHGAHVNAVAVSGHDTALTLCCHHGHVEVATMLLEAGADVNIGRTCVILRLGLSQLTRRKWIRQHPAARGLPHQRQHGTDPFVAQPRR